MEQRSILLPFLPFLVFIVPIVVFNLFLSKRKGKSPVLYGALSLIPLVGFYLAIYLASLTDKSIGEKIDKIISLLENKTE